MKTTLVLISVGIGATLITGISFLKQGKKTTKSGLKKAISINLMAMAALLVIGLIPDVAFATNETTHVASQGSGLGFLAAALSTGLAAIGAGIGVGHAGSAAIGAISEDSSILGKTLIVLGLAEGVAIYGLVISIMILQRL
ncbi:MAG: ATP synthase subunit C [Filifactoraceae bacterium]